MNVLITGGTGTLGKALLRRFYKRWHITVLSRDELKQAELARFFPKVNFIVGDVRDPVSIEKAMRGIDTVIHCAAMKRIEICEKNPLEAVRTNILGTENIVYTASKNKIKKLVFIGTDKAVEPVNVYGMTKAIGERITTTAGYNVVRYGNVFGSRGSVIPLFHKQVSESNCVTVTDRRMTRFMLTLDDAISLIAFALESPMQGSVFVKKSPIARIIDIAECFSPNIKIIGRSTGEKIYETLVSGEEANRSSYEKDYIIISSSPTKNSVHEPYTSEDGAFLTKVHIKRLIKNWSTDHD